MMLNVERLARRTQHDPFRPHVSIAFVNRNDGYSGDLEERISEFIDYYAPLHLSRWPDYV